MVARAGTGAGGGELSQLVAAAGGDRHSCAKYSIVIVSNRSLHIDPPVDAIAVHS